MDRAYSAGKRPCYCCADVGESGSRSAYLSICLAYKNEASYLREWIEFHRVVGVERFFLYNHASTDDHREALAPYIEDGVVTLEDWPDVPAVQTEMYNRCLEQHRDESRWIAFIDADEFLFSPTGRSLPEMLADYEQWPGVVANWTLYGSSGHRTRPPGLLIESYLWRNDDPEQPRNRLYKCIVDPRRVSRCLDPHSFAFTDGTMVDERKRPITGQFTDRPLWSRLRINHYMTRSEEEAIFKYARGRGSDAVKMRGGIAPLEELHDRLHDTRDDALTRYVPAVSEALKEMAARAPFDPEPPPLPPPDEKALYAERGQAALRAIEAAIQSAELLLPPAAERSLDRILVFPSGRGHALRALTTAFPDADFTAGDLDREAVDFCVEAFGAAPLYSHEDPDQIETDATFGLIWCDSLFTHLDERPLARIPPVPGAPPRPMGTAPVHHPRSVRPARSRPRVARRRHIPRLGVPAARAAPGAPPGRLCRAGMRPARRRRARKGGAAHAGDRAARRPAGDHGAGASRGHRL